MLSHCFVPSHRRIFVLFSMSLFIRLTFAYMYLASICIFKIRIKFFVLSLLLLYYQTFVQLFCASFSSGSYESSNRVRYKHFYINATQQTFIAWTATVLFLLLAHESMKYLTLLYERKRLRWTMVVLYGVNV